MRAMLLCAGLGTRLSPLGSERPKPVVPVANRPLGSYALDALATAGIKTVVVNTHHLPDMVRQHLTAPDGMDLLFVHEPRILGSGGGPKNAETLLFEGGDGDALIINGDMLFAPDLVAAVNYHRQTGAMATMIVRSAPGRVDVDGEGRIHRLRGRPLSTATVPLESVTFTGVQVLSRGAFADLPQEGCIIESSYIPWIERGDRVVSHRDESPWLDVGTLRGYMAANLHVLARGWMGTGPATNIVHPRAQVAPTASLDQCVVGSGAHVGAGVSLSRAIIWDGARVIDNLADVVVTPRGVAPIV